MVFKHRYFRFSGHPQILMMLPLLPENKFALQSEEHVTLFWANQSIITSQHYTCGRKFIRTVHIIHVQIHESIYARNTVNVFDTLRKCTEKKPGSEDIFHIFLMDLFMNVESNGGILWWSPYSNMWWLPIVILKTNIECLLFQRSSIIQLSLYTSLDAHKSKPLNTIVSLEFLLSMMQNLTNIGIWS